MNKNSTSHAGLLVTGTGDDIDIDVELIGGRTLRMSASGDELGAWPIDECHIEPDPDRNGTFRIVVDGDDAVFTPVDPVRFRSLIEYVTGTDANGVEGPSELRSDTLGAALDSIGASEAPASSGSAADDPVAFLFGSSGPPASQDVDAQQVLSDPPSEEDPHQVDMDAPDLDAVEPSTEDLEPVDLDEAEFDWDELEEVEITIEPVSAHSTPVQSIDEVSEAPVPPGVEEDAAVEEDAEIEDDVEVEADTEIAEGAGDSEIADDSDEGDGHVPADETPAVVSPPLAVRLEEAERLEAEESFDEMSEFEGLDAEAGADGSSGAVEEAPAERARFGGSALDRLSEAISSVTSSSPPPEEDYDLETNNVADEVLTTQRSLRDHRLKGSKRSQRLKLAVIAGVTVGLVALIALLAPGAIDFIQNYEGDAAPPPTLAVTETTVVTTTTVPEETTVPDSTTSTTLFANAEQSVFALSAPEFVARWDAAAAIVDEVLQFGSNPIVGPVEEQFTPYLSFVGEIQPDGSIGGFSLVIDPSGPSEYDRIGIQALGVAIATVDPDRSPQGRAALLGELGLNVREPQLGGIDGSVQSDGVQYTLVYDAESTLLTLTVLPAV